MKFLTFAFTALLLASPQLQAKKLHIIVDPGHGGTDTGATRNKIKEAHVTLKVGKILYELLREDPEFDVTLTRKKDRLMLLSERTYIAQKNKGDLFLSIHANSSEDPAAHGSEFYFQSYMPPDEETLFLAYRENNYVDSSKKTEETNDDIQSILKDLDRTHQIYTSQIFAEMVQKHWKGQYKMRRRPIKQGPFHVLYNVGMPSVLVELGFISNEHDRNNLIKKSTQKKMAHILYRAIQEFKEKIDKKTLESHITQHAKR